MNLTIDLNTIVLLCGLIINGAIMLNASKQRDKFIVDKLQCHGDDIDGQCKFFEPTGENND